MKKFILAISAISGLYAQQTISWVATTGDVVLSAATTAATLQQVATSNTTRAFVDQVVVYCSVACNVTLAANGTAATATAGTITPIQPAPANTQIPLTFWTASNVGAGTNQGQILHLSAGSTVTLCFSPGCGAGNQYSIPPGATSNNLTVNISSITGTANITFYGRTLLN